MLPVCTLGASVRQHTGPTFMVRVGDEPNTEGYGSLCVYTQHQKLDFFYGITVTRCVSATARSLCLRGFNTAGSKKAEMDLID